MTTQLKLYNECLLICGERQLATVTDNIESRYLLDSIWNNGAVDTCLSQGQWRFAIRSQSIDSDAGITPEFGYRYAFAKPTDWVATSAISSDEYFRNSPDYTFEAGYWYADIDPIYLRYVSNDAAYGTNYSEWPSTFADFVAAYLASKIVMKLTSDENKVKMTHDLLKRARSVALNHDAQNGPAQFLPSGSWVRARTSGGGREGGGNNNSLIG